MKSAEEVRAMSDKADGLELLEEAREAYGEFRDRFAELGRLMRRCDMGEWNRVEAYPGWQADRDQGAGMDMEGWFDEIEDTLNGKDEEVE